MDADELKQKIEEEICQFLIRADEEADALVSRLWRKPLVGYADVYHPYIRKLKEIVGSAQEDPLDVLPGARTVLCCFVPFSKEVTRSGSRKERLASPVWAQAYEITNAMLADLQIHVGNLISSFGFHSAVAPSSRIFDPNTLISGWSHRHFAYAAGLGTFGVNNMLLTRAGCSGRLMTMVTDLPVKTGEPMNDELCRYKKDGSCGVCIKTCPEHALGGDRFAREKCYALCLENASRYTEFGSSYETPGGGKSTAGSEVCGKCITGMPCAFWTY